MGVVREIGKSRMNKQKIQRKFHDAAAQCEMPVRGKLYKAKTATRGVKVKLRRVE